MKRKSLFKQLAKAFDPDLEPDPLLREHKKGWMQRPNSAYAAADLREMLQLEMEWLGEEATNLATAGDAKLQVYCMVLKEQIADLKRPTSMNAAMITVSLFNLNPPIRSFSLKVRRFPGV